MALLDDMILQADSFSQENKWDADVIKINSQILTMDARNINAYARLGRCYLEQEKWHLARQMYLTLLFFDRNDRIAKNKLHLILAHLTETEDETDMLAHLGELDDYYELLSLALAYKARDEQDASVLAMNQALQIGKPRTF